MAGFQEIGAVCGEIEEMIVHKARLWLDDGRMFGKSGEGFQRVNAACPRKILEEALHRIKCAVEEAGKA